MIRKFKKKFAQKKAFTLIELIVVIAIIGVLAAILVPTMNGFVDQAKTSTDNANARTIYSVAAAELAFAVSNNETVASGAHASNAEGDAYITDVLAQLNGIEGTFTITVSATGSAVTSVAFTPTGRATVYYPTTAAPAQQ